MTTYIIRHEIRENARVRLFCFPYAGGSTAVYRPWLKVLPQSIELCAVELPGRGHLRHLRYDSTEEMLAAIIPSIEELLDKPFAFFGHSFGSIFAYEVTKHLQKAGKALPQHLFVSSRRAPHIPHDGAFMHPLPDAQFIEVMQKKYNAIPQVVLNEKDLLAMLLPTLKADIKINETYLSALDPVLAVPMTISYGKHDTAVPLEGVKQWCAVTSAPCEIIGFDGGHFFIDSHLKEILATITTKLHL